MNSRLKRGIEVGVVAASALAAWVAESATAPILLEVQKALIGFAGLVVTIFGIWIAVIFPVLSGLLANGKTKQEVAQLARYDVLVASLYRSCFSLSASFFVFLVLSFFPVSTAWVARAAVFFSWLVFTATAWALWSAVWNGEGAVVGGIDDSLRAGMIRRVRAMGRAVRAKR